MKNIIIILALLFVGCASKQQISQENIKAIKKHDLNVEIVEENGIVLFEIENTYVESITIANPRKVKI